MGRPKGSGKGLVRVGTRVEPSVFEALSAWRLTQIDPETQEPISEAVAVRELLRWSLENHAQLDKRSRADAGYAEGLRRGRGDLYAAINEAWEKLNR